MVYIFKKVFNMHIEVYADVNANEGHLNSQTANDGCSKQSNFKYTTVVLLWKYCKYRNLLVTEIISSPVNIYITIH